MTSSLRPPLRRFRIPASVEATVFVASLFWMLAANTGFFRAALKGRELAAASTWGWLAALAVLLTAGHLLLVLPLANRWTVKPLLAALVVATAFATYFMQSFGVYLDPGMLRNVLHTDLAEARELAGWTLVPHLAVYAGLPLLVLWRVQIVVRPWQRALAWRLGTFALAGVAALAAVLAVFQPFSSWMRNHKEVRYLATPANLVYSTTNALVGDAQGAAKPRQAIGNDARPGPRMAARSKPLVVVLVVGETARAANWGLNGYTRQTTPELARIAGLANFTQVTSCGTNTEVSVPCLFAPVGRRDYDEARIRGSESLLHVVARAGVGVHWRDNQSGCKGVCTGLPQDTVSSLNAPGLCRGGHCLDEGLIHDLDTRLAAAKGTQLWVLHQLGNHGPSYFRRVPPAFERFQPACRSDDLSRCTREEVVNAYDNALLYTDHLLATLIGRLQAHADTVDVAMLYVSDHGESLGENGLFLHGVPYAIAPDVQTRVPMVAWLSDGAAHTGGVDLACLRARAAKPASHDHLFHTLLGLLDVRTTLYEPAWDLAGGCRADALSAAVPGQAVAAAR
jgi:lipid A ethanolaminephosphotransferase